VKLKRTTYRHIEAEIYDYYDTLKAIKELRETIIHSSGREEAYAAAVGEGYAESAVERRATQLADNRMLREMQRITQAIADAYGRMSDQTRLVVWVKYGLSLEGWQPPAELAGKLRRMNRRNLSARDMAWLIGIDESTFHRHRTGFVRAIAERLGWW